MDGQPHWRERVATPREVAFEFEALLIAETNRREIAHSFGMGEIMRLHEEACRIAGDKAERGTNA